MRPFLYPTFLGRSWAVRNESTLPDDEVIRLLGFVLDRTGGLGAKGAVLIKHPRADRNSYSGQAGDRRLHEIPGWVNGRTRFYMRITIPREPYDGYGKPRVCWHSTVMRRLGETEEPILDDDGYEIGTRWSHDPEIAYAHIARLWAAGERRLGRWPIYHVDDWREVFVHLAAHEACHLLQYDRERGAGGSEIYCEEFALDALLAYRDQFGLARAATGSSTTSQAPRQTPAGLPLGDGPVTGPATAGSPTNRKEQTMSASTPTASTEANPMQDLFASLLEEATKVADSTGTVEKSAYTRVDLLLEDGKKHKTLAYVNHPSTKAVRVEVPKKGGGGYDVIRVEKPKDIDKALKAIRANHDRIVASQTAAA